MENIIRPYRVDRWAEGDRRDCSTLWLSSKDGGGLHALERIDKPSMQIATPMRAIRRLRRCTSKKILNLAYNTRHSHDVLQRDFVPLLAPPQLNGELLILCQRVSSNTSLNCVLLTEEELH